MDRITAIRTSLKGFVWGWFGLVPILGLVPALIAGHQCLRVRRYYHDWNPARNYLIWGLVFSRIGYFGTFLAVLAILLRVFF